MIELPTKRTRGPFFVASNTVWFCAFCPIAGTGFACRSSAFIPAAAAVASSAKTICFILSPFR